MTTYLHALLVSIICVVVLAGCAADGGGEAAGRPDRPTAGAGVGAGAGTGADTSAMPPTVVPGAGSQAVVDAARGASLVRVDHVVDGDTIELADGRSVRLAQVDTPERYGSPECYGRQASATLQALVPRGARVRLERDPALDSVDRYGRVVRYVRVGGRNTSVWLVRRGAASVWFYGDVHGRYARRLMAAAHRAKAHRRGLWGACRGTALDPTRGVATGFAAGGSSGPGDAQRGIAALLPSAPPYPPDVDCADIAGPVRVTEGDPHNLDRDGDGVGCD